ncbi:uncharacterized protein LOC133181380 [Saccostrea echinata]|uniref:uncharacterized protein LOC133181380 n=1 Tax=Saccostrea echinata TaxID=191078 RepID=UPI002A82C2E9|nr:uncharacterized protein LOC133181380 [Saccostrea echinata]
MAQNCENACKRITLKSILEELKIGPQVIDRFVEERIDVDNILSLSDEQLNSFGITTIGDRIRLREMVKCKTERCSVTLLNSGASSVASMLNHQRNLLFTTKRSKRRINEPAKPDLHNHGFTKHQKVARTWTVTVVCLADKEALKVPSSSEKDILFKAGLGTRKIQFLSSDKEADVLQRITSDKLTEDGQTFGFPQLNKCGGFELLKCKQNCRELSLIDCEWSVSQLKAYLGSQTKLYIRPVQTNLSTESIDKNVRIQSEEICRFCKNSYAIRDLRQHVKTCKDKSKLKEVWKNESDSDSLPDPLTDGISDTDVACKRQGDDNKNVPASFSNLHDSMHFSPSFPFDIACETQGDDNKNDSMHFSPSFPSFAATSFNHQKEDYGETTDKLVYVHEGELEIVPSCATSSSEAADFTQNETFSVTPIMYNKENKETVSELNIVISSAIDHCLTEKIVDPVEILRYMQSVIVTGRKLELEDLATLDEGDTTFILVDRANVLETALDEINAIKDEDLRKTLEVNFYNECASDQGGPRKEFFRLVLSAIKEKYFDKGLREHLAKDYITVGKIMALSMLQNGPMPTFLSEDILNDLFSSKDPNSLCLKNLRTGLDSLGLIKVGSILTMFVHLLRPSKTCLTLKAVTQLLKPQFSEDGSNDRKYENYVYAAFLRYLRAAASGRRGDVSLQHVLQFVTGASEEPILGFCHPPSIEFVKMREDHSFIPTANTCINSLKLPRGSLEINLPKDEELFPLFDYAFLNTFYGLV